MFFEDLQSDLTLCAPKALSGIGHLMEHSKSDTVKLKAAQDILDRAGFKAVDRKLVHQINFDLQDITSEQLDEELQGVYQSWLDNYLHTNNLKIVEMTDEEIAELEHGLEGKMLS